MNYQFALIGFPIKHSLSPWIHDQFLKKAGLNGSYSIIEITPDDSFEEKIAEIKDSQINGFNVTVPYKKKIIPYLDELDLDAKEIGAVNTVVNRNGKWIGYNTDGKGYFRAFDNKFPGFLLEKDKKVLIIGAGGAARGIFYALSTEGCHHIDIANRSKASAMEIANLKNELTKTTILSLDDAVQNLDFYDFIIQTTSVGMKPKQEASVLSVNHIKTNSVVSDIIYQPIMTTFLKQAQQAGARVHFGHTMLLFQAQYAFEIWTGKQVPIDKMDDELKLILEGW